MMLEELGSLVAAVIPAVVLARVERRPWSVFGLPGRQAFGRLFWIGVVVGICRDQPADVRALRSCTRFPLVMSCCMERALRGSRRSGR